MMIRQRRLYMGANYKALINLDLPNIYYTCTYETLNNAILVNGFGKIFQGLYFHKWLFIFEICDNFLP